MAGIEKYSSGIGSGMTAIAEAIKTINALKFDAALRQAQRSERLQDDQRQFSQQKELMGLQTSQAKELETFKSNMTKSAEREERSRLQELGKVVTPDMNREAVADKAMELGLDPRNASMFSSKEELMRAKESGRASSDAAMLNAIERAKSGEETRKKNMVGIVEKKLNRFKVLIDQNTQTVAGVKTPRAGKEGEIADLEARMKTYEQFLETGKYEDTDLVAAAAVANAAADVAKQQRIVDSLRATLPADNKNKRLVDKINTDITVQTRYLDKARQNYTKQLEKAGWIEASPSTQQEVAAGKAMPPGISNLMDKGTIEQKDLTTLSDEELFQLATGGIK